MQRIDHLDHAMLVRVATEGHAQHGRGYVSVECHSTEAGHDHIVVYVHAAMLPPVDDPITPFFQMTNAIHRCLAHYDPATELVLCGERLVFADAQAVGRDNTGYCMHVSIVSIGAASDVLPSHANSLDAAKAHAHQVAARGAVGVVVTLATYKQGEADESFCIETTDVSTVIRTLMGVDDDLALIDAATPRFVQEIDQAVHDQAETITTAQWQHSHYIWVRVVQHEPSAGYTLHVSTEPYKESP